ncbi:GtrA family protein [Streptomyces sp. NBC_00536]|uniref:GtrA family protein n=1 Tax=Streptomyces sp. NBC_00536 TaxID=2975769 RepID=UPI002E82459C|nr:GtrA family protein [Streptomyces sp. NBC_00536]WUC79409.1 GtrA family protein [Streptomyces sp. NBC_00536]
MSTPSTPKHVTLSERFRGIGREVLKFGAVGGMGVLVNFGVFNLLRHTTDLAVVRASVIAIVVAIISNYIGFRYFTYRDRDRGSRRREMTLFVVFSLIGMVIESGVLYAATYGFGWDSNLQSNIFKFLGMGIATVFRFWSYRTWVFRALPETTGATATTVVATQRDADDVIAAEPEPVSPEPATR